MARPLRLEFAGALYHVTEQGDCREDIYAIDNDRSAFLLLLTPKPYPHAHTDAPAPNTQITATGDTA